MVMCAFICSTAFCINIAIDWTQFINKMMEIVNTINHPDFSSIVDKDDIGSIYVYFDQPYFAYFNMFFGE